ncbi:hypothetical protein ACFV9D_19070 [Streptomyces sp. NPDC059875]|uniref:hypothetical protein n=1 Tax=unclassified Streptomyces TaxID=2593676 RepID=UPI00364D3930
MSAHALPDRRTNAATEKWVFASCAAQVVITTVHHVRGALVFDTPGRYHSILIALILLAVPATAYALGRATTGTRQDVAWWTFWATTLVGFAVVFGAVEGVTTHVITPVLRRGYPSDEPFDLVFEATGILHILPAVITATLLIRLARSRRSPRPDRGVSSPPS